MEIKWNNDEKHTQSKREQKKKMEKRIKNKFKKQKKNEMIDLSLCWTKVRN